MVKDKIIVITGASSGIGVLTARKLAERGAVPVLCARSPEKLQMVSGAIHGLHGRYVMDVTDEKSVNDTVAGIMERYGRIDVLVNNAGFGRFKPFIDAPVSDFAEMMETNYMGVVRCTKAAVPHMMARGQGHIVNIASMAGKIGTPKSTGYTASKHAVLGLTNALRHELRGSGIFVSAVNPGPIDTPFFEQADPGGSYVMNVRRFMMTADKVAGHIVRIIERPRAELDLPWLASAGIKLYHLFPRLADRIAGPMLDRK